MEQNSNDQFKTNTSPELIAEDRELARRYLVGQQATEHLMGSGDHMTGVTREELEHLARDGQNAAMELHGRFDGLVKFKARQALHQIGSGNHGVGFDDLYQIGWVQTMASVIRYAEKDESEYPLKTYIAGFLQEKIVREARQLRYTIRVPDHRSMQIAQVLAINRDRLAHNKPLLTDEKIADVTGVQVGPLSDIYSKRVTTGDIHHAIRMTSLMGSLDTGLNPREDFSYHDDYNLHSITSLTGETTPDPEEEVAHTLLAEQIAEALATLTEREQRIIEMRFGIGDKTPMTYDQIGKEVGLTRERIRQIEAAAMGKLRHQSRSGALVDYLSS